MKYLFSVCLLIMTTLNATAQSPEVAMADALRADGKIWAVIAVFSLLLMVLFFFLLLLERRIRREESKLPEHY